MHAAYVLTYLYRYVILCNDMYTTFEKLTAGNPPKIQLSESYWFVQLNEQA